MSVPADVSDELYERLRAGVGAAGAPHVARHPVNEPAIADWCDAMGDENPCYTDPDYAATSVHGGLVAPPATLDVWDRGGLKHTIAADDPRGAVLRALEGAGFLGVVAVNAELDVRRYLRPGDVLSNVQILDDVSPRKQTALGEGHFVTTRHRYTDQRGEHVGDLTFRVLKFRPGTGRQPPPPQRPAPDPSPSLRPRPGINRDNAFLWEGYRRRELRIQRCDACGALQFPPGPRCPRCGGFSMGWVVASGRGRLYSYAVPHHPAVNGFRYPLLVGLVELEEGTRMVADIVGCPRDALRIGMPVEVEWLDSHPALVDGATDARGPITLPQFRPAAPVRQQRTLAVGELAAGDRLPVWCLPVTTTLIVSGAVATRDFTEVHHDRDLAVARGSKDVFMNINTSLGLMQRYVTDFVGPQALVAGLRVRLGASAYPGDPLVFTGTLDRVDPVSGRASVAVRATNSFGEHVAGSVELVLPGGSAYPGGAR